MALPLRQEGKKVPLVRLWRKQELWKDRILRKVPADEHGEELERHLRGMERGALRGISSRLPHHSEPKKVWIT